MSLCLTFLTNEVIKVVEAKIALQCLWTLQKGSLKKQTSIRGKPVQTHYRLVSEITNRNGKMPIKPLISRFSKNRF